MSVIVRSPEGKIIVMTKGADSIIIPRLQSGQDKLIESTSQFLTEFANEGLRTLLVGQKEIDQKSYDAWNVKYQAALCSITDRAG